MTGAVQTLLLYYLLIGLQIGFGSQGQRGFRMSADWALTVSYRCDCTRLTVPLTEFLNKKLNYTSTFRS